MERKQIFFFAIASILLIIIGGCVYFVFQILPGGVEEFEKTIVQLDTSEKLVEFMNKNFILELREGNVAFSPEQFFQGKKGGAQDFAVFAAHVLDRHKYDTVILRYKFFSGEKTGINTIVVFRDPDPPSYLYFDDEGKVNVLRYGRSSKELLQAEEARLDIDITEYTVFRPGVFDLTPENWKQYKRISSLVSVKA